MVKLLKGKVIRKTYFLKSMSLTRFMPDDTQLHNKVSQYFQNATTTTEKYNKLSRTDIVIKYWWGSILKIRRYNLFVDINFKIPTCEDQKKYGWPAATDREVTPWQRISRYLFIQ